LGRICTWYGGCSAFFQTDASHADPVLLPVSSDLPSTNITHMYASEGTNLTATLKKQMMTAARRNRRYDKRHYNKVSAVVIVVVDVVAGVAGDRGAVAVAFYFVGGSLCFILFLVVSC
jgi:hypothetical protein